MRPDLLPQEKTDILSLWYNRERNRFFRNDSKYPESGGDRDLPEPLFPIAGKDKFSNLWRPCDASTSLAEFDRNLSSILTPGREHMRRCARGAGGAAGLVVLIFLLCRCRLDYFALHSVPGLARPLRLELPGSTPR